MKQTEKMDQITTDPNNARIHDELNQQVIEKSLADFGAGRSILIDGENVIIAGNGVYEQAQKLGLKVKVIESDGSELIAVKRTDLKTDDPKRNLLAVVDNKATDLSHFNLETIATQFDSEILMQFGFQPEELNFRNIDEFTTEEMIGDGEYAETDQLFIAMVPEAKKSTIDELQKICLKHEIQFRVK